MQHAASDAYISADNIATHIMAERVRDEHGRFVCSHGGGGGFGGESAQQHSKVDIHKLRHDVAAGECRDEVSQCGSHASGVYRLVFPVQRSTLRVTLLVKRIPTVLACHRGHAPAPDLQRGRFVGKIGSDECKRLMESEMSGSSSGGEGLGGRADLHQLRHDIAAGECRDSVSGRSQVLHHQSSRRTARRGNRGVRGVATSR